MINIIIITLRVGGMVLHDRIVDQFLGHSVVVGPLLWSLLLTEHSDPHQYGQQEREDDATTEAGHLVRGRVSVFEWG